MTRQTTRRRLTPRPVTILATGEEELLAITAQIRSLTEATNLIRTRRLSEERALLQAIETRIYCLMASIYPYLCKAYFDKPKEPRQRPRGKTDSLENGTTVGLHMGQAYAQIDDVDAAMDYFQEHAPVYIRSRRGKPSIDRQTLLEHGKRGSGLPDAVRKYVRIKYPTDFFVQPCGLPDKWVIVADNLPIDFRVGILRRRTV